MCRVNDGAFPAGQYQGSGQWQNFEPNRFYITICDNYWFNDRYWPQGSILPHGALMIDPDTGEKITCYMPELVPQLARDFANGYQLMPWDFVEP
jgi:hypothetical protein